MNNRKLQDLIQNFDPEKLIPFMREKNTTFKPVSESLSQYDDEDFMGGIKLGEIPFSLYESFIICAFNVKKTLSERSGKKNQYEKAKKILKDTQSDAGIFVFYDEKENFRFSLVYSNYLGKKRDWSTFRRFTYFVSPELTNKTFLQRMEEGDFSSLDSIKEAFSVEKVTKEFYQEISYWYFWACQKCQFPKDAEEEENGRQISVIRLITRLIFVWFMRERGLIKKILFQKEKNEELLVNLQDEVSTYYLAILQNLFFATLNTKKEERQFRSKIRGHNGYNPDFNNHYKYRHQGLFSHPEKMKDLFCDIPFLNGGLFECLDEKEKGIYIDGFTETKKHQPYIPNELFFSLEDEVDINYELGTTNKRYKVKGLFEIFSNYNFTIDENTVDDNDIALDPELLGRVFENLLASFNPETSTTARKSTGSYYTPREIVDYMVNESLKSYFKIHLDGLGDLDLKIDLLLSHDLVENPFDENQSKIITELVENVRIVDPAVGSGAFPMGILNKLVLILSKVDQGNKLWKQAQLDAADSIPDSQLRLKVKESIEAYFREKNPNYGRKLYLIQKCIYGVDIQLIAVEIAKLRFFISLLVEETIEKDKENWGIEPLPNLEFKIMQGNSLISEYLGIDFKINKVEREKNLSLNFTDPTTKMIKMLDQKKMNYQSESDRDQKTKLRHEIEEALIEIFDEIVKNQKDDFLNAIRAIKRKYSVIKDREKRELAIEVEKQKLNQKSGFDLVKIENEIRQFTNKSRVKSFFPWELYFAEVFMEKNGFDIVIGNPPYIKEYTNRNAFDGVRDSPYYQGKMDIWYMFACQGLDLLRSKTGILCFIATNNWVTNTGASKLRNKISNDATLITLLDFGDYKIFEKAGIQTMVLIAQKSRENVSYQFDLRKLIGNDCSFANVMELLKKIESHNCEYLHSRFSRKNMIDKFFVFSNQIEENLLRKIFNKSNFFLSKREVGTGIDVHQDFVNQSSKEILGKNYNVGDGIFILSNHEKKKLNLKKNELKIIKPYYTTNEMQKYFGNALNSNWIIYTDSSFKDTDKIISFPNIKKHLDRYSKIITSDNKPYGLHRSRNENLFIGEKIISLRKCLEPTFTYTDFDCYVSQSFFVIKTINVNLRFLTGLLNSKLVAFWLRKKGKMQGLNYQIDKEPLLSIPIFVPQEEIQNRIIKLVDNIIEIKRNDIHADISLISKKIDYIVYDMYGLNEEDILEVETWYARRYPKLAHLYDLD